jgi:hypothetical protein
MCGDCLPSQTQYDRERLRLRYGDDCPDSKEEEQPVRPSDETRSGTLAWLGTNVCEVQGSEQQETQSSA